jgi:hypothetical protein
MVWILKLLVVMMGKSSRGNWFCVCVTCRWSAIAAHLPGRTDNEIKNYWNTHLKKRLMQMGIDPVSHDHKTSTDDQSSLEHLAAREVVQSQCTTSPDIIVSKPLISSKLSHMLQWDSARLEAEARLANESASQLKCSQVRSRPGPSFLQTPVFFFFSSLLHVFP